MRTGALLVVGLSGPALSADDRALLEAVRPGGVIIMPRHVVAAAQLTGLVRAVRGIVPDAVLSIDAEGGPVDRLRAVVAPAPAAAELALAPPSVAERSGRWIGHALRTFDLDLDLAPVVDLDSGRRGNALDRRYFGTDPRSVTSRAGAFLRGLGGAGVAGCLKHFPGLGGATRDTHLHGATVATVRAALSRELEPFRRLAPAAAAVMLSHAAYPAIDGRGRPASVSPPVLDLLRSEIGFSGVAFSDDLGMEALACVGDVPERGAASIAAGCDAVLLCNVAEHAEETVRAIEREVSLPRRQAAAARVEALAEQCRERRHCPRRRYALAVVRQRLDRTRAAAAAVAAREQRVTGRSEG